ncbi:MAG TPA: dehydrogenase E1 component subunit alpha/beta [Rhizomicrobium sp.]|nr:dehydrogenase E1 component subunit alpha/beta [Rhizomicrobium sp.]
MTTVSLDKSQLLSLYRSMQLIRYCEERLAKSHQRGLIHGACHTYVGEEAIAAGVCAHLHREDAVFSTHRGHGHALAKGLDPCQLVAELYGREAGCSHGRGGSMHLFAPEIGLMGTSGIVGPCILQAAGAGYSFKLLKKENVGVAFFGDGAVNNGAFHEGLNLAGIWNLPVIFVCENNQYATEVPFAYAAGNPSVSNRATAYGLPGIEVDGNDVIAVYRAAEKAVAQARAGGGATLIECKTYRTRPHAEGMGDFTYRSREEVERWKARCPIARLRRLLLVDRIAGADELDVLDRDIAAAVEAAHEFAESSPYPNPALATSHIFANPTKLEISEASRLQPAPEREISYMKATLEALSEEMAKNPAIFVVGEGIGKRGGNFNTTTGLFDLYGPERLRDTPICERGFVGLAGGAAMTGTRPVVDFMFADFILDGLGEILNQIAKIQYMSCGRIKMPLLLRGCIGIGHSAATHHSGSYYSMFAHFPGLRVVVPSTPFDAKGLLKTALNCDDPVLFLEHREVLATKGDVPTEEYFIDFGKASIVRTGTDVTVVALAAMVHKALAACDALRAEGISVELIDPRTVAPFDFDAIAQSVCKTGRLLIVDEGFAPCGIGAEIAAQIGDRVFDDLDAPICRLNGAHTPTPYSPSLESAVVPNPVTIAAAIRDLYQE